MTSIQILATIVVGIDIAIVVAALTWPEPHGIDPTADSPKPTTAPGPPPVLLVR